VKKNKRLLSVSAIVVLLFSALLTACNDSNTASQSPKSETPKLSTGTDQAKTDNKEQPLDISIMTLFYTTEPPGKDNVIVKEVEKRTNTKLNITWVSPNNYRDKVDVTLASGDIPDLMLTDDPFNPQVRILASQGALWDISPYIKDYSNLARFPMESWNNTKMQDGKNYGIPRVRPVEGGGFLNIRKDWLDKLNLKVPQTMDELYTALKAFVDNDPDGNGKNDTLGYAGYVAQDSMGAFGTWNETVFNQTNGAWKLQDNKLVNINLLPGTRDSLVWLSNAYKDKIIPEDFAVLKYDDMLNLTKSGRAGSFTETVNTAWPSTMEQRKTNPNADFLPLVSLNGFVSRDSGYFGMFVIPKTVPEQKMKKLLKFMDYGASDEGHDLAWYGFKDVHYTEKDGIKFLTEQAKKDIVAQQAFGQIFGKYDKYQRAYESGMPKDVYDRNVKIIDERAKVSQASPAVGLYSQTMLQKGTELNKKIQDLKVKVIMGKQPIGAWDDYVNKLKTDPDLIKITNEINDSYQKRVSGK
jgi:putative aldouronate transport system substrate-binding protein